MPLAVGLIFAVLGPPIGLVVLMVCAALAAAGAPSAGIWQAPSPGSLAVFVAFAYVFGGLQAILTGLVGAVSCSANDGRRVSLLAVMAAAGASAGLFWLAMRGRGFPVPVVFAVHLAAGAGGWCLASLAIMARGRA